MTDHSDRTFSADFKRFFLRGLVILLPSVLTLWIVVKAYQFVDTAIAEPVNRSVRIAMNQSAGYWAPLADRFDPSDDRLFAEISDFAVQERIVSRERVQRQLEAEMTDDSPTSDEVNARIAQTPEVMAAVNYSSVRSSLRQSAIDSWWQDRWYMNLIGLIIAIVAVYIAGRLLGGFVGRRIYRKLEGVLTSVPVFKQVYPYVKQIVDFLFSDEQPIKFNRVVVVEYPRKGIWSVGFLTGPTLRSVAERAGRSVTIFIPSSPTPFTGYTITVPADEVIEVPISVEEAIRFAVSGGVLIPDHQMVEAADALKDGIRRGEAASSARTGPAIQDEPESTGGSTGTNGGQGRDGNGGESA